jgi:Domain of unknown function (DUF4307)
MYPTDGAPKTPMIDRPAARYGRQRVSRRSRRWWAIGLGALVLVAGVIVAIIASQRLGGGDVQGELGGYQLVDDETLSVTVKVTRSDPSRPAVCIVRARAIDGSETGRREVLVPPSPQDTVNITTTIKSTRPPVVGDVYGCGTDVPAYLVAS